MPNSIQDSHASVIADSGMNVLNARNQTIQELNAMQSKIITPINIHKLIPYLSGYDPILSDYLIKGFTTGFELEFSGERSKVVPKNLKSAIVMPDITESKVTEELNAGRIIGPFKEPPFKDQVVSPIGLHPKKTPGKFRLITHLSFPSGKSVNDGIPMEFSSVKYASVPDAIKILKKLGTNTHMAKIDIKNAYEGTTYEC